MEFMLDTLNINEIKKARIKRATLSGKMNNARK